MLKDLDTIAWSSFPQPDRNRPGAVPSAIRSLAYAETEQEAQAAYHRLLFATGNNHAGTYYPVVLPVVPFLAELLTQRQYWPRIRTLDVLIDLVATFTPEPGYESISLPDGHVHELSELLHFAVAQAWLPLEGQFLSAEDYHERELAQQLTEALADNA